MARIGIDAHAIGERLTGNETYITNLLQCLLSVDTGDEYVLFFTRPEAAAHWKELYPQVGNVLVRPEQPLLRIPLVMPRLARRHALDMLHVQYAGPPFISVPVVTTVHDISYEHFPQYFTRKEVLQFRATIPLTARRAARVLTVSEYSKRDIVETYGIEDERVVVTYNGVSPAFRPLPPGETGAVTLKRYGIEEQYLLAVGNLQPRKNLVRLFEAYTRLRDSMPDIRHKLVVVGKKAWKFSPILDSVRRSRWNDDIILTDYVPDEDLPVLYACAQALVYPSVFEGFGLPPVEAMACGTPVIVSDRSALPEITGEAGMKVDPFDVDGIASAMATIIREPGLAERLREAGLRQAGKFTWEECAQRTLAVYHEASKQR